MTQLVSRQCAQDMVTLGRLQRYRPMQLGASPESRSSGSGHVQRRSAGKDNGAFDQILEFAHVAGPIIARQGFHFFRGNGFDVAIHAAGVLLGKVADEQGNILGAVSQRRNDDGETFSR